VQDDVIQRDPAATFGAARVDHPRLQRHARLGDIVSSGEPHERVRQLVGIAARQEPQPSEVHAEYWYGVR
jgi:hypothetical protein